MAFAKPYQPRSRTCIFFPLAPVSTPASHSYQPPSGTRVIPQRDACQNREETTARSVKTWKGGGERCERELMEGIPNERLGLKKKTYFARKMDKTSLYSKFFMYFCHRNPKGVQKVTIQRIALGDGY